MSNTVHIDMLTDTKPQQCSWCEHNKSNKAECCAYSSCNSCAAAVAPNMHGVSRVDHREETRPMYASQSLSSVHALHALQLAPSNTVEHVSHLRAPNEKADLVPDRILPQCVDYNENYFMSITLPFSHPATTDKISMHDTPTRRGCTTLMCETNCSVPPSLMYDGHRPDLLDERREERDVVFHSCHTSQQCVCTSAVIDTYSDYGLTSCSEPTTAAQQFNGDTSRYYDEEYADDAAASVNSFSTENQSVHPSLGSHGILTSAKLQKRPILQLSGYTNDEHRTSNGLPAYEVANAASTASCLEGGTCMLRTAPLQSQYVMSKCSDAITPERVHTATAASTSTSTGAATIAALTHTHVANGNSDRHSRSLLSLCVRASFRRVTESSITSATNDDIASEDFLVQPLREEASFLADTDRKMRACRRVEPLLCHINDTGSSSLSSLAFRKVRLAQSGSADQSVDHGGTLKPCDTPNYMAQRRRRNSIAMKTVRELLSTST